MAKQVKNRPFWAKISVCAVGRYAPSLAGSVGTLPPSPGGDVGGVCDGGWRVSAGVGWRVVRVWVAPVPPLPPTGPAPDPPPI